MTRGTIYLYDKTHEMFTIEFNGDMYRGGHYEDVVRMLHEVQNASGLRRLADIVNESFEYPDEENVIAMKPHKVLPIHLNMLSANFYDNWFSDYSFIKNMSGEEMIVHFDEEDITVPDGGIIVCNFHVPDLLYKANGELIDIGTLKGTQQTPLDIDKIKQK